MILPSREDENGGMAFKRTRNYFCAFNPKTNAIVLDRRKRGLRNPRAFRKLILAKALQLSNDADGLTDRDVDAFFRGTKLTHYGLR